jgi:hypothetical protein
MDKKLYTAIPLEVFYSNLTPKENRELNQLRLLVLQPVHTLLTQKTSDRYMKLLHKAYNDPLYEKRNPYGVFKV